MARKFFVVLVLLALIGLTMADTTAVKDPEEVGEAAGPSEAIGSDDQAGEGSGFAEAGPVGGPVPNDAFNGTQPATAAGAAAPKNDASTLEISTIVAGFAGFSLVYFLKF